MLTIPNCLIQNIFSYILNPQEITLLNNVQLNFSDIDILLKKTTNHNLLLKEFMAKTKLWRIKWLNKDLDVGTSDDEDDATPLERKYESSRNQLLFLTDYWNYHYNPHFDSYYNLKFNNNCEEEFITDNNKYSIKIFKNLKLLKDFIWCEKNNNLFKPGINNRLKPIWKCNTIVMEGDL